jgi:hypothetical protein
MRIQLDCRLFSIVSFVLLSLSLAKAQNNLVTLWSFQTHEATTISRECSSQAQEFLRLAQSFPRPSNWRFVVVCDDFTWRQFIRRSGQFRPGVETYGSTNLSHKTTYIRGWALTHVDLTSGAPSPARIMAHELAHAILRTEDDRKAEEQAIAWLKNAKLPVHPIREAPQQISEVRTISRTR